MSIESSVEVQLAPELLRIFFPLLQEGVEVEVATGCSVKQLLTEQFGISAEYIASRITTLFLNSRAVDDAATALVHDGAVLALSGAMPGLVGATMRSGGFYAAMRGAMTYHNDAVAPEARRGRIKLKLFNLLLEELGARVLTRGIVLGAERFQDFLSGQPPEFRPRGCWLDGRPISIEGLQNSQNMAPAGGFLNLKVNFGD
jgi:hypothetical protein